MTVASLRAAAPPRRPGGAAARPDLLRSRLPLPVILYLLGVVIPIGFQVGPLAMTTLRLLLLALIIPLTVRLLMGRFGRIYLTDVLFAAHILWVTVALAANNPDRVVEQVGSVGTEFLGGYLVGRAYVRSPEAFAALCRTLVLIVCLTLPLALYETRTGDPILIRLIGGLPGLSSLPIVNYERRLGLERVQAILAHPIHYGLFCSVAFSLSFVALRDLVSPARRILASAVIALCGFLALSSGALLAMALQIGLIAWSVTFARLERRWWLLVALFALAYVVIDLLSNRTPIRVFMSYATFSPATAFYRSIIFDWGMVNVWGSPVFGIGLRDWVRASWMRTASMDNFWLVMAVRYGIPGFLLLAAGYALGVARVMRRDFRADPVLTQFRRAWVFTFLGLSFTLVTVHIWTNIYSFVFFMFGAGMWFIDAAARSPQDGPAEAQEADRGRRIGHTRFPRVRRGGAPAAAGAP